MRHELDLEELEKAMQHKYVRRTGGPGNYTYWYKIPGDAVGLRPHDDVGAARALGTTTEKLHAHAKKDHLKRLVRGKRSGVHSQSNAKMAAQVGVPKEKAAHESGIQGHVAAGRRGDVLPHSDHEVRESLHHDVGHADYEAHIAAGGSSAPAAPAAPAAGPSGPAPSAG